MNINKITITDDQRKALTRLWFRFGNNGSEHTHGNHRWIQCILEHGDDDRAFFRRVGRVPIWKPLTPECEAAVDAILAPVKSFKPGPPAPATPKFTKPIVALYCKRLDGDYDFVACFDRDYVERIPQNAPLLEEMLSSLIMGLEGEECGLLEFDEPDCPQVWDGPVPKLPELYGLYD